MSPCLNQKYEMSYCQPGALPIVFYHSFSKLASAPGLKAAPGQRDLFYRPPQFRQIRFE
jgi:hypothetical protein